MKYAEVDGKLSDYRRQIAVIREKMRETLAAVEPQPVQDYELANNAGAVRLSELFGDHEDLILIHNMGSPVPTAPYGPMATTASIPTW